MRNGGALRLAFPCSRHTWHQADFPTCMGTKYCKGQHAQTLKANKAKCFRGGKSLVNKYHYLPANLLFSRVLSYRLERHGRCFCMCLHMQVHVSPLSPLLPTQADPFHVKWAVINWVISLHQLYLDESPKSNTKKKGLALETSVKAILNHRSN